MPTLKEIQIYIGPKFIAHVSYDIKYQDYIICLRDVNFSKVLGMPWNEELMEFEKYRIEILDNAIKALKDSLCH